MKISMNGKNSIFEKKNKLTKEAVLYEDYHVCQNKGYENKCPFTEIEKKDLRFWKN